MMRRRPLLIIALAVTGVLLAAGIFMRPPGTDILRADLAPSSSHLLGTTPYGHDTLLLITYATLRSAAEALWATLCTLLVGSVVGVSAALTRERSVDRAQSVLARLLDSLGVFLVAACLAAIAPRLNPWQMGLLLSLAAWPTVSNVIRSETIHILRTEYVEASRAVGAGPIWIARKHVLPAIVDRVLPLSFALTTGYVAVFGGLAFLGVGSTGEFGLGFILFDSHNYLNSTPWYFAAALGGFLLLLLLLGFLELTLRQTPVQIRASREAEHTQQTPRVLTP